MIRLELTMGRNIPDAGIVTEQMFSDFVKSESVVPEIYAKNAGIIGSIHGAKNDPIPAKTATKIVISDIC